MRLTQRELGRLEPGRYSDSGCPTLTLLVKENGSRYWVQRLRVNRERLDRGLGRADGPTAVTLAKARETAARNRYVARAGGSPFGEPQPKVPTFADTARECEKVSRERWSDASLAAWQSTMRVHVLPRLGKLRCSTLTRQHIVDCLNAVAAPTAVKKAKMAISNVLEVALSRGWVTENPARNGGINAAVPALQTSRGARQQHHEAMPYADVPAFVTDLPNTTAGNAMRLIVLTACRSAEVREARWKEFDLKARVWTIPEARMKTGREHRVPLSDAALAVLQSQQGHSKTFVFPGRLGGRPISGEGLAKFVRPRGITLHGFRSSFRDWVGETRRDTEAAEHALSHVVGSAVERSYARSDLLDRRRDLMDAWAAVVAGGTQ